MYKILPVEAMYDQRKNFVVVALTGISGSGCSDFARLMSLNFSEWKENIREKKDICDLVGNKGGKQAEVFSRKYAICYDYCAKQYEPYTIISYKNVLMLFLLQELADSHKNYSKFVDAFIEILKYKFHNSYKIGDKVEYEFREAIFDGEIVKNWGITEDLYNEIKSIGTQKDLLSQLFFSERFKNICNKFYNYLKEHDYYAKNFFVHRLATAIRATGKASAKYEDYENDSDNSKIFSVVTFINDIIKGYHQADHEAPRRFVIDSIRCSMEILYLRERYNAFYMIALHNECNESEEIEAKVEVFEKDAERLEKMCANIMHLSHTEMKGKDFEAGKFYAPDLSRCVSESEIHISFKQKSKNLDGDIFSFYSYAEQWMKYAALILRPGLITPSRDERCMSIAYVAKFNSGCISRQVGCTIVNSDYAVMSVGWNDPPSGQLPCSLRNIFELIDENKDKNEDNGKNKDKDKNEAKPDKQRIFSRFEIKDKKEYMLKGDCLGIGFKDCLKKETEKNDIRAVLEENGMPYPYCFRTRYSTYTGNKDNVNTRSLHAEENTMLRIAQNGGAGLKGGTMYVTASPCVLCSKKAYQIGIKDIVYLDPYTDIAPDLIIECGYDAPHLRLFNGAIGQAFYKLYRPFMPYKDELKIWEQINR